MVPAEAEGLVRLGGLTKQKWLDGLPFGNHNNSDYHGDVGALGKRFFNFVPGSTNLLDYSGRGLARRGQVDTYLPTVFRGMDPYYGFPLPTVAARGTFKCFLTFETCLAAFVSSTDLLADGVVTDTRAVSQ